MSIILSSKSDPALVITIQRFSPTNNERDFLAHGLAVLGDGNAALKCLRGKVFSSFTTLAIGKALLKGDAEQLNRGEILLTKFAKSNPYSVEGLNALRLLTQTQSPNIALLETLPEALLERSPDFQALKLRIENDFDLKVLFERWPKHPVMWELQWDLTRKSLLKGNWAKAELILNPHFLI